MKALSILLPIALMACSSTNFGGQEKKGAAQNAGATAPAGGAPKAADAAKNTTDQKNGNGAPYGSTATGTGTATGGGTGTGSGAGTAGGASPNSSGVATGGGQSGPGLGTGSGTAQACNSSGDFVKLQFPADIQKCLDSGKLFDFSSNTCFADVAKATSYDCTFASIAQKVTSLGLPADLILGNRTKNAKLVGCGERRNGETIVLEWWVPPAGQGTSCAYNDSLEIGVECYATNTSSPGGGPSGTAAGVANCVNGN